MGKSGNRTAQNERKMSVGKTRVAIVAPVHNRRDITLQCLRSLSKINEEGLDVRTYIVDDGSTDGTSEAIATQFPNVNLIKGDGTLWFTEGTNVGIRAALADEPDFVLLMNDDQIFDADFLHSLVKVALASPRSVVGSLLLLWDTPHKVFQVAPVFQMQWGCWRHWHQQTVWTVPDRPWEVDLIVGNCLLVPAQAFRDHGLMNSKRYPNFGDAEFTPRLRKAGWKLLIDPLSRVFCQPNNLPAAVRKMSIRQKANALFFDLKHIQNLRRRFFGYWDGAPSRPEGVVGFFVFFLRIATGKNYEGQWGEHQPERPLKDVFADRVVS